MFYELHSDSQEITKKKQDEATPMQGSRPTAYAALSSSMEQVWCKMHFKSDLEVNIAQEQQQLPALIHRYWKKYRTEKIYMSYAPCMCSICLKKTRFISRGQHWAQFTMVLHCFRSF